METTKTSCHNLILEVKKSVPYKVVANSI